MTLIKYDVLKVNVDGAHNKNHCLSTYGVLLKLNYLFR